ncbi:MAG TPA: PilT/PilU family type 4a pilus ATPase [Gemmataceae bacterium]|nr:PilT/PilU family type 4a pilus ATPase [Gemmataceae bacterium]
MSHHTSQRSALPEKLRTLLIRAVEAGASDLHFIPGHALITRLHGDLTEAPGPSLEREETQQIIQALCPPDAIGRLDKETDLDFSFELPLEKGCLRFRANLFRAGGELGACLRVIPTEIPSFGWAGFPGDLAERLALLHDGLVFLTGATGSGKTTTLAMIVNLLNQSGGYRILTVEEPVEYVFPWSTGSAVTQREVGRDVPTFADGLKYGLRQDPDVILVGEVRDHMTAQMALSAAETGHLVFTTLHTRDAKGAITRFADLFPQEAQRDVRSQLAMSLRAILSQRLLPGAERGSKRQLALEVLWNTHPIASAIRSGKVESIDTYLLTGREDGMLSFDESIRQLLRAGRITQGVAADNVTDPTMLNR